MEDIARELKLLAVQREPKRRGLGMACFCYKTGTFPFGLEVAGVIIRSIAE